MGKNFEVEIIVSLIPEDAIDEKLDAIKNFIESIGLYVNIGVAKEEE